VAYQVIARKWRPQRFDDVVGQQAVTRTLRNALASGRLAQSFVFAGPRGVGKTTTARILARALNCELGPTPDPCGTCEACVEITEGRDMDVLEIDAATHTGIDNVREVIIAGLAIRPVRNRYKVFIIDEVHQLSSASFNSLLKSIEEPPPHVVFMMATTELDKIPETVLSRSQVYEFRTIGTKAIATQLRTIVDAERIAVGDESLQLIARDADGSMRDAQSKLDQVIAFTGSTISGDDVAAVLGLVGRDLLLDTIDAVADEDALQAFALAARAVEMGYDLRAVCRELSRVVRDLLVLSVDPSRLSDPEIAGEGERDRLTALVKRFSREDLLRAFDLLTRAEGDIRNAAQPRYHLEMALLRWMHLRKLVPLEELLRGGGSSGSSRTLPASGVRAVAPVVNSQAPSRAASAAPAVPGAIRTSTPGASSAHRVPVAVASGSKQTVAPAAGVPVPSRRAVSQTSAAQAAGNFKDALLAEIRTSKVAFYNTVVAQAQTIEAAGDRLTFTFAPNQRALRAMFDEKRTWLEALALEVSGRKIVVAAVQGDAAPGPAAEAAASAAAAEKKSALREQALADAGVQAMLDVFPAEIRDVEEM
jgi:DNA polymerase III subunit gamma/tau